MNWNEHFAQRDREREEDCKASFEKFWSKLEIPETAKIFFHDIAFQSYRAGYHNAPGGVAIG